MGFIGGLILLAKETVAETDPMPLGVPMPAFIAFAIGLVVAILLAAPTVRWLGGKEGVEAIVRRDAAYVPYASDETVRSLQGGMSARDQRLMIGFMLIFPCAGVLIALANFVNDTFVSAPVDLTCGITRQERNKRSNKIRGTFSCTLPNGESQRAVGIFDAELTQPEGPVPARRGALGVWLLPKSSIQR